MDNVILQNTLSAFFLMLWTFMIKAMLISLYFSLLYCGVAYLRKFMYKKINVSANYYCWYLPLCSVALANLNISNHIIFLSYYPLYSVASYTRYTYFFGCLLSATWLFVVIFKLTSLARMNHKIRKSMKCMERYDDNEGLAERAAVVLNLQRKPDIMIACYIETPVSYGVFKKTVLLPDNYEEKYTTSELYLLLLHEMTHIKHGDTVKLYMISLVECFLWLTPVMRLFVKSFKRDSEILCDNHVIGLQNYERDTYATLILKECAYKTARFSDSYQAVENRLDALYRYKAGSRLKKIAIIPAAVLMICALSYALHADWFIIDDKFNPEFEIIVFDEEYINSITLPPDAYVGIYVIEDGKIIVDTAAFNALTRPYADEGYCNARISSDNYVAQTGISGLYSGCYNHVNIREPAGEQELSTAFSEHITPRTPAEFIFLLITSWL